MITFFTTCKAFLGEHYTIQRNAIQSWQRLSDDIVIIGDEEGMEEAVCELGVRLIPEVKRGPQSRRPMVHHLFELGDKAARYSVRCYVNSDIILMPDFLDAVRPAAEHFSGDFLLVGQRWDVDLCLDLDFGGKYWPGDLRKYVQEFGALHPTSGMDFFCYRGDPWGEILPFRLAYMWDTWLLWRALQNNIPVVDITKVAMVVHQSHKSRLRWDCPDANYNRETLVGKDWRRVNRGTQHATWVLTKKGLHRR